jgi:DNA-binding SARP family transcriptional activator/Fe2+ transport system protein FeoA
VEFRILGPLEVIADGEPLDLGGRKQRAVLAMLLIEANRVVSTDRLIEALWDEAPPETAPKAVQVYVSQLRKVVGKERLETKAPGYRLRVEPDELDLGRFLELQSEAKFGEALSLWRGGPLADFAYDRFARAEIERLVELRLACLEERTEQELARGRHAELVGELEALVREYPLRERLRAQLMVALYRSGRQAEALEVYQSARRMLVEELGIEPGRSLRDLHQAVLRQDAELESLSRGEVGGAGSEETAGAFVGREAELHELLAGLEEALAGHGRLIVLHGEPGIGKSRLAEELLVHARRRGARVLVGRCWEAGGAPAYWPWVQSLRAYIRDVEPSALDAELGGRAVELAQILPELREVLPALPEPASSDSEGARFRLFDATAEFLRNASRARPLVVFLDDLHAADEPSLLLLQFVARSLADSRLLVLGAYRDVDPVPGEHLTATLAELARERGTRRLSLDGLAEEDVAEYVELTASEIAAPAFVAALHEETEGNPLFVGEIVRLATVEGAPSASDGDVRLVIPETVREVIGRRLAHRSKECNRLLELGSVLGREFTVASLARVGGVSVEAVLETLDEALAARLVSEVPRTTGRLRFAHVLIRDTLYEAQTAARRARLHRRALEALEELYGEEPGAHLAELAHHALAGNDFDKGLRYAWRAGDRASSLLAYEEAARLYETALEALRLARPADERTGCELLLSLGEAQARAGNAGAAKKAFLEAAELARRLGLARELARAAAGYGGRLAFGRAGDDDRLVPLLEEGLAVLTEEDVELRARLLARLAGALRDQPSRERRDALSLEALELARRTGSTAALAHALDGRASAIVAPDTVAEFLALGTELRQVAEQIGDRERVVSAHSHRLIAHLLLGDLGAAETELAASTRIAHELRQPVHLWRVGGERALLALASGRLDEAEQLVAQALAHGERADRAAAISVYRLQRYTLADLRGTVADLEPALVDLALAYPARPVFRCAVAHLYARLERRADAERAFGALSAERFAVVPFDQEWLYALSLLAETCAYLRDTDAAAVLYELLSPYAALNAVDVGEGFAGSVSRYLGVLATMGSRWNDAEVHFEDALAMNERMAACPWLAHTQRDLAMMLVARDAPGDRERAHELLAAATATYRELGMETHAARANEGVAVPADASPAGKR